MPGLEIAIAARLARDWRKSHRHDGTPEEAEKAPLGFNTSAVSHEDNTDTAYEVVFGDDEE